MGRFIYDRDLRHERVNLKTEILSSKYLYLSLSHMGDFANLVGTMLVQLEVKPLMFGARLSVRSVNFKNLKTLKTL